MNDDKDLVSLEESESLVDLHQQLKNDLIFEKAKEILSGDKVVIVDRFLPHDASVPEGGHSGAWPNVGTPGHIDHGSNSSIYELSPGTYEINSDVRRQAWMQDYKPEDIEYEMDSWKVAPWSCDSKLGGKKRDKAKAKAQKKARKLTRRK